MDANYHNDLLKCIDIMRDHIAAGDSFILAKTKAARYLFLNDSDVKMLQGLHEYQEMKRKYLLQHRENKSWNAKLIKG